MSLSNSISTTLNTNKYFVTYLLLMSYINGREATPEEERLLRERQEDSFINYAVCMYQLQRKAKLSFKEARAYLCVNWEHPTTIAEEYGITKNEVHNLMRRSKKKVDATGLTDEEIFGEYRIGLLADPF